MNSPTRFSSSAVLRQNKSNPQRAEQLARLPERIQDRTLIENFKMVWRRFALEFGWPYPIFTTF
jgi:hypothetical protein